MNQEGQKAKIKSLATEYYQRSYPDQLDELNETWEIFNELDLLDGDGIVLEQDERLPSVAASSETWQVILSAVVLGVISNAVYDTLKWSAERLASVLDDPRWQKKYLKKLGALDQKQLNAAQDALHWILRRLLNERTDSE